MNSDILIRWALLRNEPGQGGNETPGEAGDYYILTVNDSNFDGGWYYAVKPSAINGTYTYDVNTGKYWRQNVSQFDGSTLGWAALFIDTQTWVIKFYTEKYGSTLSDDAIYESNTNDIVGTKRWTKLVDNGTPTIYNFDIVTSSGSSEQYLYTVSGATGPYGAAMNGDYWDAGYTKNGQPVYTSGDGYLWYDGSNWCIGATDSIVGYKSSQSGVAGIVNNVWWDFGVGYNYSSIMNVAAYSGSQGGSGGGTDNPPSGSGYLQYNCTTDSSKSGKYYLYSGSADNSTGIYKHETSDLYIYSDTSGSYYQVYLRTTPTPSGSWTFMYQYGGWNADKTAPLKTVFATTTAVAGTYAGTIVWVA